MPSRPHSDAKKLFERLTTDIYKQRFDGIVNLCSSLKSTDYWAFRVFKEEEDDLLDTVHDFSSAMYDNFHHLAPEIIDAFGTLCENEDIGFTLYSALCESNNVSYVHIFRATPGQNGRMDDRFNQDSRHARSRHLQRFRENRLYTRADEDDGSAGHRMYM
jgi:hypothetical protein